MTRRLPTCCSAPSQRSWYARFVHHFGARLVTTALFGTVSASMLLAAPPEAAAQTRQQLEEARDAFIQGSELFENEDYAAAAEEFLRAYKLSDRPALLYNVGQAYRLAEKYDEAEQYLQQYLSEQPDAPNAEEVVEIIIDIQQAIAARLATLSILTEPSNQDIYLDTETTARCQSPCTLTLSPGEYAVHVRAEGWAPRTRSVQLAAGEKNQIRMELERVRQQGSLIVQTDIRQGTLRIAPNSEYALPLSGPVRLAPGEHTIEIVSTPRATWRGKVNIVANESTEILVPMQALTDARSASSPLKIVSYSLGGASLGLFTGAILMGLQANDTHAALESQRQAFGVVDADLLNQGKNEQFSANVLWGAGAATLITGAGLYIWDWLSNSSEEAPASAASSQTAYPPEKPANSSNESKTDVDLLD